MGAWPLRYLRPPIIPKQAKIITFPGLPGPADAMHGRWTEKSEVRTPAEHLRWVWSQFKEGKKWRKHLSRYLQKADWVGNYWRE
jgi:hypothetical protein